MDTELKRKYTAYMMRPQTVTEDWQDWMGRFVVSDDRIFVDVRHSPIDGETLSELFSHQQVEILLTELGPMLPLDWVIDNSPEENKADMQQFGQLAYQIIESSKTKNSNEVFEIDIDPENGPEWEDPEFKGYTIE